MTSPARRAWARNRHAFVVPIAVAVMASWGGGSVCGASLWWAPDNSLSASGTWNTTTANWATNSSGTGTLQTFAAGDAVTFLPSPITTGTITVDGAVNPLSIAYFSTSSTPTSRVFNSVNSGVITLSSGSFDISSGHGVTMSAPLAGSNGIFSANSGGTLTLNVANPDLTGNSRAPGVLNLNHVGALPSSGSLDLFRTNTRVSLLNGGTFTLAGILTGTIPPSPNADLANRRITATSNPTGSATLILDRGGSDTLSFYGRFGNGTNANGVHLTKKGSYTQVLLGSLATENSNAATLRVEAGTLVFQKDPTKYAWSATNAGSKIEVAGGELRWAAGDQIAAGMDFTLSGGTMNLNGFRNTDGVGTLLEFGELTLGGTASLNFGSSSLSQIWFADSSAISWSETSTLNLVNYASGTSVLRFGTTSGALTETQLSRINVGGGQTAALDADGFLVVVVPEPSTLVLAVVGGTAATLIRRRRRRCPAL